MPASLTLERPLSTDVDALDALTPNVALLLRRAAERHGDRPAIVERGRAVSYVALQLRAAAIAAALCAADVTPHDSVAILLERGPGAAAAFFGALTVGAIVVEVNETLRPSQIEHILTHSGARCLIASGEMLARQPRALSQSARVVDPNAIGFLDGRVFRPNPLRPPDAPDAERVVFTGDMVRRDAEGFLYFVGRRDRIIKTMGYRVGPDEVTSVLHASGEVADAVVIGEPDDAWGERIVAHVVLAEHGSLERLEAYCRRELPRYMEPARIEVRDALPLLPSGKHDVEAVRATRGPALQRA